MSKQLLRSGTSVGANVREGDEEYTSLDSDNKELLRMLASIVKNSKKED